MVDALTVEWYLPPGGYSVAISSIYSKVWTKEAGFGQGYSTGSALLKLWDDIKKAMEFGELSIIVMVDFSKAFGTISHETLVHALHNYGFDA